VKIAVVGPKNLISKTSELLYDMRVMHVEPLSIEEYFKLGEPLPIAGEYSKDLVLIRSIMHNLGIDPYKVSPSRVYTVEELKERLEEYLSELKSEILDRLDKIKALRDEEASLKAELSTLEPLKLVGIPPRLLKGYKRLKVFVGFMRADPTERIREVTDQFEIVVKEVSKNNYVVVVFTKVDVAEDVFKVLQEIGFTEIVVPDIEDYDARINEIKARIDEINKEIERLNSELEQLKGKEAEIVVALDEFLSMEVEKAELPLKAVFSKFAFILTGYVPYKKLDEVKRRIESETNGKVAVINLEEEGEMVEAEEEKPTLIENPRFAKPFELLTKLYGTPKYYEIDATTLMAIYMPIMFGMMLGDIGYGLNILILAFLMKKFLKGPSWQALSNIAIICGITSIIFGAIYFEFFGPFHQGGHHAKHFLWPLIESLGLEHAKPLIDRTEAFWIKWLIVITAYMGLFTIIIGWLMGFRNLAKEHGVKEAFYEKGSWVFGMATIGLIMTGFVYNKLHGITPILPIPGQPGWTNGLNIFYKLAPITFIIWFYFFVIKCEVKHMGGLGILMTNEILTMVSQTLSFTRILAIGLSSVYIAFVINKFGIDIAEPGGVYIPILGILLLLIGHLFNTLLGVFDPGVQSVRLHYVEWFTKFFIGGGKEFIPFGRIKRFIK
jgi:V/A-type H+-transporting ATPase subunit I